MANRVKHDWESCWVGQVENGMAPSTFNGRDATCSNKHSDACAVKCAVCGEYIQHDEEYIYHHRLDASVHFNCPMTNVKGQDISTHTVRFYPALTEPPVSDTVEP